MDYFIFVPISLVLGLLFVVLFGSILITFWPIILIVLVLIVLGRWVGRSGESDD